MKGMNFTGIGFPGALTIAFIVLKATKSVDWSWWWVTAPMWVPLACYLVFVAFCLVMHCIQKSIK